MATALSRGRAGAQPAGVMETAHAVVAKVVFPVVTVTTVRTIGLQDLGTTPLALEAAVTIATVSRVYITNLRQGSNSRIVSPQSSTCFPYIFL